AFQSVSSTMVMSFGRTTAEAEATYSANPNGLGIVNPDLYKVTAAAAGQAFQFATSTPADGPGEFVNTLDPRLRVLDASGTLLASDDNGAADGRNALLNFTAPGAGNFFVEVGATTATPTPTSGEYVLRLTGNTMTLPPFQVTASNPANGAALFTAP